MANYRAIAATSASLVGMIQDRYPRDEFGSGLTVTLYQTRDFEEADRIREELEAAGWIARDEPDGYRLVKLR